MSETDSAPLPSLDYRADTAHYVAATELTQVDFGTSLLDVFALLAGRESSAIIVHRGGRPAYYVDGRKLATTVLAPVDATIFSESIGALLVGDAAVDIAVALSPTVVDVSAALPIRLSLGSNASDRAVYVVMADGAIAGYLFSHETFKAAAMTRPAQFICKRKHVNPDPDHGRCQQCPARITEIR